jgi:hypothetical protein
VESGTKGVIGRKKVQGNGKELPRSVEEGSKTVEFPVNVG